MTVAAVGAIVGLVALMGSVGAVSTQRVTIGETSGKYHFGPATAYVNVGGTVTWKNGSDAPHTVTSDAGTELASARLTAGKSYSHTFAATGTFAYHCTVHDYMVGKVVVLAAGVTAPPTDTAATDVLAPTDASGLDLVIATVLGLSVGLVVLLRLRRTRPTA
jgi:plastocyanin